MPFSTIVLTAGISAFAQRNILGARFRQSASPLAFPPGKQNPEPADALLPTELLEKSCLTFLQESDEVSDPAAVSAEFSVLHQLKSSGQLGTGAVVHLIHTPTFGGRLAAKLLLPLLQKHLDVQGHAHELTVPFDPSIPGGLALASGAFIGTVSRLLTGQDPRSTAFAPIGGYKVMVALGHTAASFHGFPSLYLHEDSQVLQQIAPAPISIAEEIRQRIASTSLRVGNGAEWKLLEPADQQIIASHPAFFTHVDDLVELNELGQFLRLNDIPIHLSQEAATALRKEHNLLFKQILQIRDLAISDLNYPGINHDWTSVPGLAHPWRIARMGDFKRFAWQMIEGKLFIYKIWRTHPAYDQEAAVAITTKFPYEKLASWETLPV